jgi:cyclic pyranopterin phosphate synthase
MRAGASDDDLRAIITDVWSRRTDRYSELRSASTGDDGSPKRTRRRIEMYQLGG